MEQIHNEDDHLETFHETCARPLLRAHCCQCGSACVVTRVSAEMQRISGYRCQGLLIFTIFTSNIQRAYTHDPQSKHCTMMQGMMAQPLPVQGMRVALLLY